MDVCFTCDLLLLLLLLLGIDNRCVWGVGNKGELKKVKIRNANIDVATE